MVAVLPRCVHQWLICGVWIHGHGFRSLTAGFPRGLPAWLLKFDLLEGMSGGHSQAVLGTLLEAAEEGNDLRFGGSGGGGRDAGPALKGAQGADG